MIRKEIFFLLFISVFIKAQDTHYSQFNKTKLLINPSLIAYQDDDFEVQLQRRSQWGSVTTPFNTFSLSFNAKDFYKEFSAGTTILNDIAGDSRFSTRGFLCALVKSFQKEDNFLSIGLQAGIYQRSVSYEKLVFLENEDLQDIAFSFFDIGFGVSNYKKINDNSSILLSVSSYHLNEPKQSLNSDENVVLTPKHLVYFHYYNRLGNTINISPSFYASNQKKEREFVLGSGINYKINNDFEFISGIYRRIQDAFFVTLGMKKENLEVIFSYDINTSTLAAASNNMGGVEFSIKYGWSVIKKKEEFKQKICPKYL